MTSNLILGPAGSGKTTRLLNTVESYLERGASPSSIAYMAFTRRAAYEARDRACERFNLSPKDLPYFSTMHSFAFRQLGLTRDQIVTPMHYQMLSDELGYPIGPTTVERDGAHFPNPDRRTIGNNIMSICSLARVRRIPLEEQWRRSRYPVTLGVVQKFEEIYRKLKYEHNVVDFIDIINEWNRLGHPMPFAVTIFDEVQDLSAQQWDMVTKMSENADELYVAGDDDQAIYRWAGANVNKFLDLGLKPEILERAHRLPKAVYNFAQHILRRIDKRYEKRYQPRDDEGRVRWVANQMMIRDEYEEGTWLLLARNKRKLGRFQQHLEQLGLPYNLHGQSSVDKPYVRAIRNYTAFQRGQPLGQTDVANIMRFVRDREPPQDDRDYRFNEVFDRDVPWMEALTALANREVEYIRKILKRGESLTKPPRISISTIHGAKGAEADNVVLSTDVERKTTEALGQPGSAKDDELRVLYVAVTRTRNTLWLVHAHSRNHYNLQGYHL